MTPQSGNFMYQTFPKQKTAVKIYVFIPHKRLCFLADQMRDGGKGNST
jgi:hypothetical protein